MENTSRSSLVYSVGLSFFITSFSYSIHLTLQINNTLFDNNYPITKYTLKVYKESSDVKICQYLGYELVPELGFGHSTGSWQVSSYNSLALGSSDELKPTTKSRFQSFNFSNHTPNGIFTFRTKKEMITHNTIFECHIVLSSLIFILLFVYICIGWVAYRAGNCIIYREAIRLARAEIQRSTFHFSLNSLPAKFKAKWDPGLDILTLVNLFPKDESGVPRVIRLHNINQYLQKGTAEEIGYLLSSLDCQNSTLKGRETRWNKGVARVLVCPIFPEDKSDLHRVKRLRNVDQHLPKGTLEEIIEVFLQNLIQNNTTQYFREGTVEEVEAILLQKQCSLIEKETKAGSRLDLARVAELLINLYQNDSSRFPFWTHSHNRGTADLIPAPLKINKK